MVGKLRTHTGFRMPPDVEKKVNALVESGEFTTKTEVITRALRFYFDNKDTNIENEIEKFLISEKGESYIKTIIEKNFRTNNKLSIRKNKKI